MNYPWQNVFYIDPNGKTVPYQHQPKDGGPGTGFVNLKRQPADSALIPEAIEDGDLLSALDKINHLDTGVFSVGCDLTKAADDDGYKFSGYIEFAINDQTQVGDPDKYFSLFFRFYNQLAQTAFAQVVRFDWVIIPAIFTEPDIRGFTCSVKMNCPYYPSQAQANGAWSDAISQIASLLVSFPDTTGKPIY
jgi:hypothetical protein